MPELPEVETMRRGILAIVGGTIEEVVRPKCKRRPILIQPRLDVFRPRAVGQRVAAVDRVGKRVVVRLKNENAIVFEPRMTGLVLVADPPTNEHLRLCVTLSECPVEQVWYWDRRGLGSVRLLTPAQFEEQLGQSKLGPDALTATWETIRSQLRHSRREIKTALLDQRTIAGIGNLYASEILHAAGIHPQRRCHLLTRAQWRRLHENMLAILNAAIRYEGSTLSDGTYRNALNQTGGYQNHHRVYDRAGQACLTCRADTIQRIVQAQRATFFCRTCQSRRQRRSR